MESTIQQVTVYNLKREDIISAVADYVKKVTNKEVDKKQLEWCGQNSSGGFDFQIREKLKVETPKVHEKTISVDVFDIPKDEPFEEEHTFVPSVVPPSGKPKLVVRKK